MESCRGGWRLGTDDSLNLVGKTLAGTYQLLAPIGEGGFGAVYRAEHLLMARHCAVKVLKDAVAGQAPLLERFRREVQLCGRLRQAGAVEVYDARVDPDTGRLFFAMELLEGESLADYWTERGKLPVTEALGYCIRVADCMAIAHDANVIHRDLKPENIFLSKGGESVRILDFGAAFVSSEARLTRPGQCIGTTLYMPDEQLVQSAASLDTRVDIYALGVTLYHLISGWLIYPVDQQLVLMNGRIVRHTPVDIQTVAPWVSDEVARVVRRAMASNPNGRYRSMRAFAADMHAAQLACNSSPPQLMAATAQMPVSAALLEASAPPRSEKRTENMRAVRVPSATMATRREWRRAPAARRAQLRWLVAVPPMALLAVSGSLLLRAPRVATLPPPLLVPIQVLTAPAAVAAPPPTVAPAAPPALVTLPASQHHHHHRAHPSVTKQASVEPAEVPKDQILEPKLED